MAAAQPGEPGYQAVELCRAPEVSGSDPEVVDRAAAAHVVVVLFPSGRQRGLGAASGLLVLSVSVGLPRIALIVRTRTPIAVA